MSCKPVCAWPSGAGGGSSGDDSPAGFDLTPVSLGIPEIGLAFRLHIGARASRPPPMSGDSSWVEGAIPQRHRCTDPGPLVASAAGGPTE
jgi:hypothetical protein